MGMNNIGLIIFCSNENGKNGRKPRTLKNICKLFYMKIKEIFVIKLPKNLLNKIKINENLDLILIKIPYKICKSKKLGWLKLKRIKKIISRVCRENSIGKCLFSREAPDMPELKRITRNPFTGEVIYVSLLNEILKRVALKKGVKVRDFNVVILDGEASVWLSPFIDLLSPRLRFLTVITANRGRIQKKADEIYNKTGLSARVTDNVVSGLKDADIVINLGLPKGFYGHIDMPDDVLIIDYEEPKGSIVASKSINMNGIVIGLPPGIGEKIDKEFYRFFSKIEFSEIIILNKLGIGANINRNYADYVIMEEVYKCFKEDGYTLLSNGLSFVAM